MIKSEVGKFYVGDPCYVLSEEDYHDVWGFDNNFNDGTISVDEKYSFIVHGTAYGDGEYEDQFGNIYGVDSGTLSVIPIELVAKLDGIRCGAVFEGKEADLDYYDDGVFTITVGHKNIIIETGDTYQEDEYEDEDWDDTEEELDESENKKLSDKHKLTETTSDWQDLDESDIKLYMNTWGNYNTYGADVEGINGGWMTLDQAEQWLQEHSNEECFINDTDCEKQSPALLDEIDEYSNCQEAIDELREFINCDEQEALDTAIESGYGSFDDCLYKINQGDFIYFSGVDNETDLAYAYIDDVLRWSREYD